MEPLYFPKIGSNKLRFHAKNEIALICAKVGAIFIKSQAV